MSLFQVECFQSDWQMEEQTVWHSTQSTADWVLKAKKEDKRTKLVDLQFIFYFASFFHRIKTNIPSNFKVCSDLSLKPNRFVYLQTRYRENANELTKGDHYMLVVQIEAAGTCGGLDWETWIETLMPYFPATSFLQNWRSMLDI